ncbi:hypothetical protein CONPUDRAFT_85591 [Coniophora puteana RWD-64-598 SS2]|uniref:HypA-like protein n=1 Tax=Coniophora puteana (strain RWD-64-598) TaxID=741705 RepID=A0A5M3M7Y5_CONPW|nr:uncharacterized protein CONPUDRAFT_85591 [Coniophora puteana RWD-64-598 SS2]EIW74781.1 hypothetical protein CONPUDRAFT_85591 [Coniophora puteana RWD-64-598 SS2]
MTGISFQKLDKFFPEPSAPPSSLCPQRLPGDDVSATEAVVRTARDNHVKHHVFFNERGFHNHAMHRVFAVYGLGATGPVIDALYDVDTGMQRELKTPSEEITAENFGSHLGDDKYYLAFLNFFSKEIDEHGVTATLEKFLYSDEHNVGSNGDGNAMLARSLVGALHSPIHIGYGLEFGIPGLVVEGLAMASVDIVFNKDMLDPIFSLVPKTTSVQGVTQKVASLAVNGSNGAANGHSGGTTAFDVIARILKDDTLIGRKFEIPIQGIRDTFEQHGDRIREHADKWTIDLSKPGELERKMEELQWLNVILYGIGGWTENQGLQANFFYMHLVTSCLFLAPNVAPLSQRSQEIFLRAYLTLSLGFYVMFGRPALPIADFARSASTKAAASYVPFAQNSLYEAQSDPKVHAAAQGAANPWLAHAESAIVAKDDHYAKIVRALLHLGSRFGRRKAGYWAEVAPNSELAGIELLDGSLFLRVAGLTAQAVYETQVWSFESYAKA